jgi:hypothetical protein
MPTPSLILVPARFKTGKLYTPVATTSGGLVLGASGDFNVTRATTATRVNASGFIESVASGVPRLDYYTSGGTASCPALLVEPTATNLALHSRDLTNAVWSGTTVTTAKNAVGADGTASGATSLTATAASGTVLQALSHASQSRVFSAYIRRVTGTGAIQLTTNGGTNWDTVTITNNYTQVASVARTVASGTVGIRLAVSGDVIDVDFTQGEVGPVATSPMATTTGTVTRNTEVISVTGAVSGCIGQTEGTIYWEGDAFVNGAQDILFINRNETNSLIIYKAGNNAIRGDIFASGSTTSGGLIVAITDNVSRTGFLKVAFAYKSGDSTLYINGIKSDVTKTTAFTFTAALDTIRFGDVAFKSGRGDQRCRAVAVYPTRLTDSELAALTT